MSRRRRILAAFASALACMQTSWAFRSGSIGRVMWQDECQLDGDPLRPVRGVPDVCGDACADDYSCSHWTWNTSVGGTCWLKSGSVGTTAFTSGTNCGYVVARSNGLSVSESADMLARINAYRALNGLGAVVVHTRVMEAATLQPKYQAGRCEMSHEGSSGSHVGDRLTAQGYDLAAAAENVAAGQQSVSAVMAAWWASEGHRENILNADVEHVGFALSKNAGCSDYITYWTQDFGRET